MVNTNIHTVEDGLALLLLDVPEVAVPLALPPVVALEAPLVLDVVLVVGLVPAEDVERDVVEDTPLVLDLDVGKGLGAARLLDTHRATSTTRSRRRYMVSAMDGGVRGRKYSRRKKSRNEWRKM